MGLCMYTQRHLRHASDAQRPASKLATHALLVRLHDNEGCHGCGKKTNNEKTHVKNVGALRQGNMKSMTYTCSSATEVCFSMWPNGVHSLCGCVWLCEERKRYFSCSSMLAMFFLITKKLMERCYRENQMLATVGADDLRATVSNITRTSQPCSATDS